MAIAAWLVFSFPYLHCNISFLTNFPEQTATIVDGTNYMRTYHVLLTQVSPNRCTMDCSILKECAMVGIDQYEIHHSDGVEAKNSKAPVAGPNWAAGTLGSALKRFPCIVRWGFPVGENPSERQPLKRGFHPNPDWIITAY
ncbi:hypothetical protein SERLA73DRAFT_150337 [Serpula lacrymans var. lacrymans S7.3]|uniref:Uncharacterized protein n=1 Tax=Serpula lacrymans var. lacrymans (strain S7.3) TaxID=936435 RepID=F8PM59_SERL3|nr:hypothetical protein SERLA73DRAFT_150337 [Serpula lacrymans var. lacrymans S7.3]